ncbi:uncharacterized protein LOC143459767 [Clavelina lepadiformis]|uniref:uncharacterized protein LOC143459767 n=1 Tax=Clavelina lepadiformis TaxID=159417 RepID=UPI0040431AD9
MERRDIPSDLLFTQTDISPTFTNGQNINEMVEQIRRNPQLAESFQPLEIAQDRYNRRWYCNDNRRLYMFRALERLHCITHVKTKVGHIRKKTDKAGNQIKVRRGETLPH